ncbi:uncharacterized protein LOC144097495 [Amblyomma americanum]
MPLVRPTILADRCHVACSTFIGVAPVPGLERCKKTGDTDPHFIASLLPVRHASLAETEARHRQAADNFDSDWSLVEQLNMTKQSRRFQCVLPPGEWTIHECWGLQSQLPTSHQARNPRSVLATTPIAATPRYVACASNRARARPSWPYTLALTSGSGCKRSAIQRSPA